MNDRQEDKASGKKDDEDDEKMATLAKLQCNPAIAHFKGLVKIMFYIEVFAIANI